MINDDQNIEGVLQNSIGADVEIGIVQVGGGIIRYTRGILKTVTKDLIVMDVSWKEHKWRREKHYTYYLNRHSCNFVSLVRYKDAKNYKKEKSK